MLNEDFRRRFIAGQAKTFTDSALTKTGGKKRDNRRDKLLAQIAGVGTGLAVSGTAAVEAGALTAPLTNNFYEQGVRRNNFYNW